MERTAPTPMQLIRSRDDHGTERQAARNGRRRDGGLDYAGWIGSLFGVIDETQIREAGRRLAGAAPGRPAPR